MTFNDSPDLRPAPLVVLFADLGGFASALAAHGDEAVARLVDAVYVVADETVSRWGGRVVKFIGDACHAVFPANTAGEAVEAALELCHAVSAVSMAHGITVEPGVNIHRGVVVEGQYGPSRHPQYDVIGVEMNRVVEMGHGPGVRISQAVFDELPAPARAAWRGDGATSTYRHQRGRPPAPPSE